MTQIILVEEGTSHFYKIVSEGQVVACKSFQHDAPDDSNYSQKKALQEAQEIAYAFKNKRKETLILEL